MSCLQSSSASGKSQQPVQPSAAPLIQPGGTVNAAYPQTNPFQPTSEPLKTIPATSSPQENPFLKKMGEVNKFAHGWGYGGCGGSWYGGGNAGGGPW